MERSDDIVGVGRCELFFLSVVPCIGSVSDFGRGGGWVILWFGLVRVVKFCFYLVPFAIDGKFFTDDWVGLCYFMIWILCIGG